MAATVPKDLATLLGKLGHSADVAEVITKRSGLQDRLTLRLVLDDGSLLKARWLATKKHADSWGRLRELIGDRPYLARLLHRDGSILLEEWVEGNALAMVDVPDDQLLAASAVLAQLHSLEVPESGSASCTREMQWIQELLGSLVARSGLSAAQANQLDEKMRRTLPKQTIRGLIHYDFCGENLVFHASRGVVSIDHEWLCMHSLEFDLARAVHRWNLTGKSRSVFLDGYCRAGGPAAQEQLDWWLLANEVFAAEVRVRRGWPDAETSLQGLFARLETER